MVVAKDAIQDYRLGAAVLPQKSTVASKIWSKYETRLHCKVGPHCSNLFVLGIHLGFPDRSLEHSHTCSKQAVIMIIHITLIQVFYRSHRHFHLHIILPKTCFTTTLPFLTMEFGTSSASVRVPLSRWEVMRKGNAARPIRHCLPVSCYHPSSPAVLCGSQRSWTSWHCGPSLVVQQKWQWLTPSKPHASEGRVTAVHWASPTQQPWQFIHLGTETSNKRWLSARKI